MNPRKCYSLNAEDYSYTDLRSVFDALDAEGELQPGAVYYSADVVPTKPSSLFHIDDLFDAMVNEAWEECGERAEGFLDQINQGQRSELNDFICTWLNTHMACSFWRVTNPQEHTVTEEDVKGLRSE